MAVSQQQIQKHQKLQQYFKLLRDCKDIPFWIEDKDKHKQINQIKGKRCCWNHYISLPQKGDRILPIFDYEMNIVNLLENGTKYLAVLKSTGIGLSEAMLRYISWKAVKTDEWKNCRVLIVTGPRIELSITLIERIKKFFVGLGITFNTNQTVVELNNCKIESFPSHHVSTMRGLTDVKFILVDEAAFFPKAEQWEVRDCVERYIGKSDVSIVMISTPAAPSGMFYDLFQEP